MEKTGFSSFIITLRRKHQKNTGGFSISAIVLSVLLQFLFLPALDSAAKGLKRPVEHELSIDLKPHLGVLSAEDALTLYPGKWDQPSFVFLLHGGFEVDPVEIPHQGDWKVSTTRTGQGPSQKVRIEIFKPAAAAWPDFVQFKFRYSGSYRDLQENGEPQTLDAAHTLLLAENSLFYPVIETSGNSPLVIFEMQTTTPPGWEGVSEGKRVSHISDGGRISTLWKCDDPMEEIHLIADHYHEYKDRWEDIDLLVFLREEDPGLAQRYLDAAKLYIPFYQRLIGTYPFVKFAVVENSEQTGYGMPSFTLLGSRVIRFPFILHTSYPHEILHNWWGNGAYIEREQGNWSEGLTTYVADHLFPDLEGKGDQYRLQELMKYKNYVTDENDFPLSEFQSRTNMTTQAIGYGKLVLVLHMLRNRVGTKAFLDGLHDFYFENIFKRAGFDDLKEAMEAHSGQNLNVFFQQWIFNPGAPQIKLENVSTHKTDKGHQLTFEINQAQNGQRFEMKIPYSVWMEDVDEPVSGFVHLNKSDQKFSIPVSSAPRAIMLDPRNEVFRRLNDGEVPPSISMTYGDSNARIVKSTEEQSEINSALSKFADTLKGTVVENNVHEAGRSGHSVWLLGRHFKKDEKIKSWLSSRGVTFDKGTIRIDGKSYSLEEHSVAVTVPDPESPTHSVTWVMLHDAKAGAGLARKLPHYGKYGYLVFKGDEPVNVAKGMWPAEPVGRLHRFKDGPLPLPVPKALVDFRPGDPLE